MIIKAWISHYHAQECTFIYKRIPNTGCRNRTYEKVGSLIRGGKREVGVQSVVTFSTLYYQGLFCMELKTVFGL